MNRDDADAGAGVGSRSRTGFGTPRKPRKKNRGGAHDRAGSSGSIPEPYLALAPRPVTGTPSPEPLSTLILPSAYVRSVRTPNPPNDSLGGPSDYTNAGPSSNRGYANNWLSPPFVMPSNSGTQQSRPLPTPSPTPGRGYAANLLAPPSIMPGGHPAPPLHQRGSYQTLPHARSTPSLHHLSSNSPHEEVRATSPQPARRRRGARLRVVNPEEPSRRLTVRSREEGRAIGLARGASMRRVNVWDDLPDSNQVDPEGDAPPPFPFPTSSNNRLPPTFSANNAFPSIAESEFEIPETPPPSFDEAMRTPATERPRPSPLAGTGSRTDAVSAGGSDSDSGLDEDEREDRRMWNADILAGYSLEERVRREAGRRGARTRSSPAPAATVNDLRPELGGDHAARRPSNQSAPSLSLPASAGESASTTQAEVESVLRTLQPKGASAPSKDDLEAAAREALELLRGRKATQDEILAAARAALDAKGKKPTNTHSDLPKATAPVQVIPAGQMHVVTRSEEPGVFYKLVTPAQRKAQEQAAAEQKAAAAQRNAAADAAVRRAAAAGSSTAVSSPIPNSASSTTSLELRRESPSIDRVRQQDPPRANSRTSLGRDSPADARRQQGNSEQAVQSSGRQSPERRTDSRQTMQRPGSQQASKRTETPENEGLLRTKKEIIESLEAARSDVRSAPAPVKFTGSKDNAQFIAREEEPGVIYTLVPKGGSRQAPAQLQPSTKPATLANTQQPLRPDVRERSQSSPALPLLPKVPPARKASSPADSHAPTRGFTLPTEPSKPPPVPARLPQSELARVSPSSMSQTSVPLPTSLPSQHGPSWPTSPNPQAVAALPTPPSQRRPSWSTSPTPPSVQSVPTPPPTTRMLPTPPVASPEVFPRPIPVPLQTSGTGSTAVSVPTLATAPAQRPGSATGSLQAPDEASPMPSPAPPLRSCSESSVPRQAGGSGQPPTGVSPSPPPAGAGTNEPERKLTRGKALRRSSGQMVVGMSPRSPRASISFAPTHAVPEMPKLPLFTEPWQYGHEASQGSQGRQRHSVSAEQDKPNHIREPVRHWSVDTAGRHQPPGGSPRQGNGSLLPNREAAMKRRELFETLPPVPASPIGSCEPSPGTPTDSRQQLVVPQTQASPDPLHTLAEDTAALLETLVDESPQSSGFKPPTQNRLKGRDDSVNDSLHEKPKVRAPPPPVPMSQRHLGMFAGHHETPAQLPPGAESPRAMPFPAVNRFASPPLPCRDGFDQHPVTHQNAGDVPSLPEPRRRSVLPTPMIAGRPLQSSPDLKSVDRRRESFGTEPTAPYKPAPPVPSKGYVRRDAAHVSPADSPRDSVHTKESSSDPHRASFGSFENSPRTSVESSRTNPQSAASSLRGRLPAPPPPVRPPPQITTQPSTQMSQEAHVRRAPPPPPPNRLSGDHSSWGNAKNGPIDVKAETPARSTPIPLHTHLRPVPTHMHSFASSTSSLSDAHGDAEEPLQTPNITVPTPASFASTLHQPVSATLPRARRPLPRPPTRARPADEVPAPSTEPAVRNYSPSRLSESTSHSTVHGPVVTASDNHSINSASEAPDDLEYTDVDVYVSRLENSGHEYEGLSHVTEFLGPARSPAASNAALATLISAPVAIDNRRVNDQGKVKLKLSVLGVRVSNCPICLTQFRGGDGAALLPLCGHVSHDSCARRWFLESDRCMVCRVQLQEDEEYKEAAAAANGFD